MIPFMIMTDIFIRNQARSAHVALAAHAKSLKLLFFYKSRVRIYHIAIQAASPIIFALTCILKFIMFAIWPFHFAGISFSFFLTYVVRTCVFCVESNSACTRVLRSFYIFTSAFWIEDLQVVECPLLAFPARRHHRKIVSILLGGSSVIRCYSVCRNNKKGVLENNCTRVERSKESVAGCSLNGV